MFTNLNAGAIGLRGFGLERSIDLARRIGFGGVDFDIREASRLAEERGIERVQAMFRDSGVRAGQWGLPVAWNRDEQWEQDFADLPRLAGLGRELGCLRTTTWCLSGSDDRPYPENFAWHVKRLRPIAEVLARHGCRLGIEFLGPRTIRSRFRHPFISTLRGMMDLARGIGTGNVGLLLDAWHHHTAGGTREDLRQLNALDVVAVHVNDAPAGLSMDQYVDNDRRLPMETGVIDLAGFLRALQGIGYDGPVTPEPFSARINEAAARDALEAGRMIGECMDRLWTAAGLA